MQREVHPADIDVEISFQLFNTPGTEVAPGSNEICEYLQCGHEKSLFAAFLTAARYRACAPRFAASSAAFFSSRRAPTSVLYRP